MRRTKQNNAGPMPSDPGDMWHALAFLRQTHSEPVGRLVPFERADALLSLTRPDDIDFTRAWNSPAGKRWATSMT
ncbi:hypothetical protein ABT034_33885 [Streptomyces sp. NPDC002773]|uniref:hypothetical protein n=1 Tax=Streptomyces sp. NPDC002773 TaxID=3154430 RepID=UPI003332BD2A